MNPKPAPRLQSEIMHDSMAIKKRCEYGSPLTAIINTNKIFNTKHIYFIYSTNKYIFMHHTWEKSVKFPTSQYTIKCIPVSHFWRKNQLNSSSHYIITSNNLFNTIFTKILERMTADFYCLLNQSSCRIFENTYETLISSFRLAYSFLDSTSVAIFIGDEHF